MRVGVRLLLTQMSLTYLSLTRGRLVGGQPHSRPLRTALLPLTTCEHRCCTDPLSLSISCVVWPCVCIVWRLFDKSCVRRGCVLCMRLPPPARIVSTHPRGIYIYIYICISFFLSLSLALSKQLVKCHLVSMLECLHLVAHRLWIRFIHIVAVTLTLAITLLLFASVVVVTRHPTFVYSHRSIRLSLRSLVSLQKASMCQMLLVFGFCLLLSRWGLR